MSGIPIVYSTTDGHTLKICETLRQTLEANGHSVTLVRVEKAATCDPVAFDKIFIGASIRYGHHAPVFDFIRAHRLAESNRFCRSYRYFQSPLKWDDYHFNCD